MAQPKAALKGDVTAQALWVENTDLGPIFVDELHIQGVGERFYLTFGQLRLPITSADSERPVIVEIHPVARLVLTKETLKKMVQALDKTPLGP